MRDIDRGPSPDAAVFLRRLSSATIASSAWSGFSPVEVGDTACWVVDWDAGVIICGAVFWNDGVVSYGYIGGSPAYVGSIFGTTPPGGNGHP